MLDLDIQVADKDGNVVDGYRFVANNSNGKNGYVYELIDYETYTITFTNTGATTVASVEVEFVTEADGMILRAEGAEDIRTEHISEAACYRFLDKQNLL